VRDPLQVQEFVLTMAADKQFKCSSLALPSQLFLDKAFFVDYIPTHPTKCLCLFCHFMKMGNNIIINTKVKIYTIRMFYFLPKFEL